MSVAIRVENLSKVFVGQYDLYPTIRDRVTNKIQHSLNFLRANEKCRPSVETFYALKDLSFTINQGEVVGLIGSNGSGKSTLLKILSKISLPSDGFAELQGQVSSLLEIGTGFHLDLTGRDNIFLSGAILGMNRKEILQKFDQIVAFAGIHKFINMPIKHYSTGMYLRLGFSVAAHLNQDIFLLDEILSPGDLEFRKMAIRSLEQLSRNGKTIICVSHDLELVKQLCERVIWLEKGNIKYDGTTIEGLNQYKNHECGLDDKI